MSKFYAVRSGRQPGIYMTWAACKEQVIGFSGAQYKSFPTEDSARDYICTVGRVSTSIVDPSSVLYCDGGHNRQTGRVAYASVVDSKSRCMLTKYKSLIEQSDVELRQVDLPVGERYVIISDFNDVKSQQNNGAELLAMWAALVIALACPKYKVIRCDSQLITEHWSKKLNDSSRAKMDPAKVAIVEQVIAMRIRFESADGAIEKISGDVNLADLGYH